MQLLPQGTPVLQFATPVRGVGVLATVVVLAPVVVVVATAVVVFLGPKSPPEVLVVEATAIVVGHLVK
jgi:hypothetical protein